MILQSLDNDSSLIHDAVKLKSQRLQLTESLRDYFALNPKLYQRQEQQQAQTKTCKSQKEKMMSSPQQAVDESETSLQSYTSTTANTFDSLDETFHVRQEEISALKSLDITFHDRRPEYATRGAQAKSLDITFHERDEEESLIDDKKDSTFEYASFEE